MIPLLWRRAAWARLALGVAALALAGGAVLGTQLASQALAGQASQAISQKAGSAEYDIAPFDSNGFSAAQLRAISGLSAVSSASALREKADLAELPSGAFRQVVLVSSLRGGVAMRRLPLVSGHAPIGLHEAAVSAALGPGVEVSTGQAAPGRVTRGASLRLVGSKGTARFRVVGIAASSAPGAPFTSDAVYVSARAAQDYFGSGLRIEDVAVRLRPGYGRDGLMRELSRAVHTQYTVSNSREVPDGDPVGELTPLLDGITALSLLLAFVVISTTFGSLVLARRHEIGLLRLAGAGRGLIFRSFLREAVATAALGGALGVGFGYLVAGLLLAISTPSGVTPAPQVTLEPAWTVGAFLLVLVLGTAAATIPAVQAARIPALQAVRPPERRSGSVSALAALPGVVVGGILAWCSFSFGGALGVALGAVFSYVAVCAALVVVGPWLVRTLGGILAPLLAVPVAAVWARGRTRPERAQLALCSLFVSVATAIGLVGLSGAAMAAGGLWVDHLFVGQYLLVSPVVQSQQVEGDVLAQLARRGGGDAVVAYAPVRFLAARVGHQAVSVAATASDAYAISGALQFLSGGRTQALQTVGSGRGALLPLELAQSLHLHRGSRLRLATSGGTAGFTVAGIVAHTLPGPSGEESVLVDQSAARRDFGTAAEGFDLIQLEVSHPQAMGRVAALTAFRYGLEEESVAAVRSGVDLGVQHDIAALSALALVGVVIAVLAAIDTLIFGAQEGAHEVAFLRIVGLSRGATRRAVLGEALATAIAGLVVGVAAGIGLIAPEVAAASSPALPLAFGVPGVVVVAMALSVGAAIVLAAWFPARQVSNLDPVAALSAE